MDLKLTSQTTPQLIALDFSWLAECWKCLIWMRSISDMLRLLGRFSLLDQLKAWGLSELSWMLASYKQLLAPLFLVPSKEYWMVDFIARTHLLSKTVIVILIWKHLGVTDFTFHVFLWLFKTQGFFELYVISKLLFFLNLGASSLEEFSFFVFLPLSSFWWLPPFPPCSRNKLPQESGGNGNLITYFPQRWRL